MPSTLDDLLEEARGLERASAAEWAGHAARFDAVVTAHETLVSHWRMRGAPPRPDFKPLALPLPFLIQRLLDERKARGALIGVLDAVAAGPDERRIDALLEYAEKYHEPLEWILAAAMTRQRAARYVLDVVRRGPSRDEHARIRAMLLRFDELLPPGARELVYDWLRSTWRAGPSNGDGEQAWRVLFKAHPERARLEVLPYFETDELYVLNLLLEFPAPSRAVAEAARGWLSYVRAHPENGNQFTYETELMVILLQADADRELPRVLRCLEETVESYRAHAAATKDAPPGAAYEATRNDHNRFQDLARALLKLKHADVDAHLAPLVHDPAIDIYTRFEMLEAFAKRGGVHFTAMLARWLREEPDFAQSRARAAMTGWGECGKGALEGAEG